MCLVNIYTTGNDELATAKWLLEGRNSGVLWLQIAILSCGCGFKILRCLPRSGPTFNGHMICP